MHDCCVIVFARAPVPGATKTRLIPALGADGAAELHRRLVARMLAEAVAADIGPVELCCTPDVHHPFFADCARRFGISLQTQVGADLGERMSGAFDRVLAGSQSALLVGSDIPSLGVSHLLRAREALQDADAVFVPADDGGYVLVGLSRPQPLLFEGIEWGSGEVMAQSRGRAVEADLRIAELDPLWDLDRPEDLARLSPELLAGLVDR